MKKNSTVNDTNKETDSKQTFNQNSENRMPDEPLPQPKDYEEIEY